MSNAGVYLTSGNGGSSNLFLICTTREVVVTREIVTVEVPLLLRQQMTTEESHLQNLYVKYWRRHSKLVLVTLNSAGSRDPGGTNSNFFKGVEV